MFFLGASKDQKVVQVIYLATRENYCLVDFMENVRGVGQTKRKPFESEDPVASEEVGKMTRSFVQNDKGALDRSSIEKYVAPCSLAKIDSRVGILKGVLMMFLCGPRKSTTNLIKRRKITKIFTNSICYQNKPCIILSFRNDKQGRTK